MAAGGSGFCRSSAPSLPGAWRDGAAATGRGAEVREERGRREPAAGLQVRGDGPSRMRGARCRGVGAERSWGPAAELRAMRKQRCVCRATRSAARPLRMPGVLRAGNCTPCLGFAALPWRLRYD